MTQSMKTMSNLSVEDAKAATPDIKVAGDGNLWLVLCKASSEAEGWMKSTKAMEIPNVGCLVQVTTQQRNIDLTYAVAEAITFVPWVRIVSVANGGRRLMPFAGTPFSEPTADQGSGPYTAEELEHIRTHGYPGRGR